MKRFIFPLILNVVIFVVAAVAFFTGRGVRGVPIGLLLGLVGILYLILNVTKLVAAIKAPSPEAGEAPPDAAPGAGREGGSQPTDEGSGTPAT